MQRDRASHFAQITTCTLKPRVYYNYHVGRIILSGAEEGMEEVLQEASGSVLGICHSALSAAFGPELPVVVRLQTKGLRTE